MGGPRNRLHLRRQLRGGGGGKTPLTSPSLRHCTRSTHTMSRQRVRDRRHPSGPSPAVGGQLPDPLPRRGRPARGHTRHAPRRCRGGNAPIDRKVKGGRKK